MFIYLEATLFKDGGCPPKHRFYKPLAKIFITHQALIISFLSWDNVWIDFLLIFDMIIDQTLFMGQKSAIYGTCLVFWIHFICKNSVTSVRFKSMYCCNILLQHNHSSDWSHFYGSLFKILFYKFLNQV